MQENGRFQPLKIVFLTQRNAQRCVSISTRIWLYWIHHVLVNVILHVRVGTVVWMPKKDRHTHIHTFSYVQFRSWLMSTFGDKSICINRFRKGQWLTGMLSNIPRCPTEITIYKQSKPVISYIYSQHSYYKMFKHIFERVFNWRPKLQQ